MMSSSATSAFRGGGAIRSTDITVTTRDDYGYATMDTAGTGTTVAPGMVTTMAPAMDTAMAADQGICGVCGDGNKSALRRLGLAFLPDTMQSLASPRVTPS
jgi:predicted outer membrane repeat protein